MLQWWWGINFFVIIYPFLLNEFDINHVRKSKSIVLSGGERRRLEIARTLASRPKYLLLDEPLTGIDPVSIEEIKIIIKKFEKAKGWLARKLSSENHAEQAISILEERSIWQRYGF